MRPEQQEHYGAMVWTNVFTDFIRREECLCLNCDDMSSCKVAQELYRLCKENDLALMMTRCKSYRRD